MKSTASQLRPTMRQLLLDRARSLVPGFVDSLAESHRTVGDPREASTAWARRWCIDHVRWIVDSGTLSPQLWEKTAADDRRIVYSERSSGEPVPVYRFAIAREFFRTADPESWKESIRLALEESLEKFIVAEAPAKPVPAPAFDMLAEPRLADTIAAVDCLVLRLCMRMPPELIMRRVYPNQKKNWNAVLRSMKRISDIVDIQMPGAGRPKIPQKT